MTGSTQGGEYLPDMESLRVYIAQQGKQHVASIVSPRQERVGGYDAFQQLFDGGSLRGPAYDLQRKEMLARTQGLYEKSLPGLSNGVDRAMISSGLYMNALSGMLRY